MLSQKCEVWGLTEFGLIWYNHISPKERLEDGNYNCQDIAKVCGIQIYDINDELSSHSLTSFRAEFWFLFTMSARLCQALWGMKGMGAIFGYIEVIKDGEWAVHGVWLLCSGKWYRIANELFNFWARFLVWGGTKKKPCPKMVCGKVWVCKEIMIKVSGTTVRCAATVHLFF